MTESAGTDSRTPSPPGELPAAPPAPPSALGEAGLRAAVWAFAAGCVAFVLFAAAGAAYQLRQSSVPDFLAIVGGSFRLAVFLLPILFFARWIWSSRWLLSRSFAAAGFTATFLGLCVLAILFVRLGIGAKDWFEEMPALIEAANKKRTEDAARGRQLQDMVAQKKEETEALEKEMLAEVDRKPIPEDKKEAERKEVKQLIADALANELKDLPRTAQELIAREQGIRPNTSPGALLGHFFTAVPSASPQDAGILPALVGSLYMALITILVAVPLGVGAAVYLEEYRGKGVLNRLIQLNISNLAGVPSVVYGILGAFVFVDLIFRPIHLANHRIEMRNALGGGLTLALLTLPVVIISAQEALRAVPTSIRHAAVALGATRWQVVKHHVLPNAMPGILTGTILAVSRTLGEAAPLVLFGSLLYVQEVPGPFSSFTVMPMQVFKWMDEAETAWKYNAAMGSLVLMLVLLSLNATAIYLRQRFHRSRW